MKTKKMGAEKKPTKPATKKSSATKPAKARGRTAEHDATKDRKPDVAAPAKPRGKGRPTSGADAYRSPTIDSPPKPEREPRGRKTKGDASLSADRDTSPTSDASSGALADASAAEIPGDVIDGAHLARCIRFAARVVVKGCDVVFTHDEQGLPLVSGHDQHRLHTGYLTKGAAMLCDIAVPRSDALSFADMLDGLEHPLVRIDKDGRAIVHHGTAQPEVRYALGSRTITQAWRGPSQEGTTPARVPLTIPAAWQAAACRWPAANVCSYQSSDGVEWLSITDDHTGEVIARAVLAQDGRDLFPEDDRQTEIPGTRTAGSKSAVGEAVKALRDTAAVTGVTLSVSVGGEKPVTIYKAPTVAEAPAPVSITAGGEPVPHEGPTAGDSEPAAARTPTDAPAAPREPASARDEAIADAWPDATTRHVVFEVPTPQWDALSPEALVSLHEPLISGGPKVQWLEGDIGNRSVAIEPAVAFVLSMRLRGLGLGLRSRKSARIDGIDVDHWIAGVLS